MSFALIFLALILAVCGYFYLQLTQSSSPPPAAAPKAVGGGGGERRATPAAAPAAKKSKEVVVLFGSQTGTAEMFAKTLAREAVKLGVPAQACDVEFYDVNKLEDESLAIMVCATYGEGEPTDSMKNFHDWIMDDCRMVGEELSKVKFAVFGLGDRQYKYFCEEGIVMDRRLEELGAERIYGVGCGDSGNGQLEEEFDEWRRDLWPAVGRALNITLKANVEEPVEPQCRMKYWEEEEAPLAFPKTASVLEPTQRLPLWVPIVRNEELLKDKTRSTRLVEFNIKDTIISYQAGDHLGILPHNPDALIDEYLKILNVTPEEAGRTFSLQDAKTLKNVFPARVSVRTALKWYIDLAGIPKKSTLRAFAHCCTDPTQKEELLKVLRVNPESQKEYTKLCQKLRNIHGFLRKFDSAKVPLSFFLELMPRISPRYFSISSDLLLTSDIVGATVAHVEGGLCTTMLRDMKDGDRLPVFIRKSTFHLPLRAKNRPIIMIGPGTGVAPFVGFIKRRQVWKEKGNELGKAILFFGCRNKKEDYIYEDLFNEAVKNGILSDVDVAFSREQTTKVYVQHRIKARAKEVWEILNEGGNLYICGDAKHMAKDVEVELINLVKEHGKMDETAAKAYLKKMETEERFLKDVWSSS
ncbi:Flavodoxin/FAD binding domain/Oxidoreductase NAD-binding domain containing protein, putative [Angomonas deanei]|uniref:NADPH--hemoprotein reductase n=1 Tax=Angomonas deanei TaxID=59799 RepID=A0A7G2CHT3_9TRYP|nr:Flavodoxin/FAD binding domain/Oxidoreductase NAD-binding domain containing protein, putative [Angomonas deanei]